MIDVGIAVLGGIFFFSGRYGMALLLIALAILSGLGAVLMAVFNPDWYQRRRMQAGLDVDLFNARKGVGSLIVTKLILIGLLCWAASYVAKAGGYL